MHNDALPEDVEEYLQALLHCGLQVADMQYDDVARRGMYIMVKTLADHFGYDIDIDLDSLDSTLH